MMKHTLFNMAVGCLAALSLAACGGGGGSDSSSASAGSSLLSPGYNAVLLGGQMGDGNLYTIDLNRGGECCIRFWDAATYEEADVSEDYEGRWTERQLADGSFEIQITGLPTTDVGCDITCNNPMTLRIPAGEMAHYRAGEVVTGSFDSSPLTHGASGSCYITTEGQHSASPAPINICQSDGLK
ncbi:MAG: hypothetical protein MR894_04770 [Akkermansia muciniphila]|nr:hypothetical protein [Akkermansia muciniphila]